MNTKYKILSQLKNIAIDKQGLSSLDKFGTGLSGTLDVINHLGYIQIDTLYVVERAHHHILWSRIPDYEPENLNQLIKQQNIFEYWYHAASYLPIRDYRYALLEMESIRNDKNRYYNNVDKKLMYEILARITTDGPLQVRDLDKDNKPQGSWWGYGSGKKALTRLFMQGDIMVCERNGMEKTYDLRERCLPQNIDLRMPTIKEYANYLLENTIRSHGVFTWKQLLHLKSNKLLKDAMRAILDEYIASGLIIVINIDNQSLYVEKKALEQIIPLNNTIKILSPFDSMVIHRERLNSLFQFDYKIECYVPAAKRIYGYFCLPILFNNQFIGRIDCKTHRKTQRFEIIKLHIEDNTLNQDMFFPILQDEIQKFASFNKCQLIDGL